MKRILFVILILLILSPENSIAEGIDASLLSETIANNIQDICPYKDDIAVLETQGIFCWSPGSGEYFPLQEHNAVSFQYCRLISSGDKLFFLDAQTGILYHVTDGQAIQFFQIAEDMFFYQDQDEQIAKQVVSCIGGDSILYVLLNSFTYEQGDVYELYALDINTCTIEKIEALGIQSLWEEKNGQLLVGRVSDGILHPALFNPQANEYEYIWSEIDVAGKTGFSWDTTSNTLYYTADSGKVYAHTGNESDVICAYLPFKFQYSSDKGWLFNQNTYAYMSHGSIFLREIKAGGSEIKTLTIMGMPDERLVMEFAAQHPEIAVNLQDQTDDMQALQRTLVLSDSSVDLFLVASDGLYSDVKRKGYAAALNSSDELMRRVSAFYPWVREVLMDEGKLIALPSSVSIDCWTVNQTQWSAMDIGQLPQTMEQLFQLVNQWQEDYAEDYPDRCLFQCLDGIEGVIQDLVRQYLLSYETWEEPVSFDREDFRAAVANALKYKDAFVSEGEQVALLMNYPQYFGTGYNDSDLVASMLPVRLTENSPCVVRGTMELWILNPASAHPEEALLFLEFCMAHLESKMLYYLDASCTHPLRPKNYDQNVELLQQEIVSIQEQIVKADVGVSQQDLQDNLERLEKRLQNLQETSWEISNEDIAIYQQIAPYVVIPLRTIYPKNASTENDAFDLIIGRFVAGQITLDQFIQLMDEKAQMIFWENQ